MGHVIVCASTQVALLLKVHLSDERGGSQKVFEVIIVYAHVVMVVVVVAAYFICRERHTPRKSSCSGCRSFDVKIVRD